MSGRTTSRRSKNIIKLIEAGVRPCDIIRKGYPQQTVRYHWRKIFNHSKYEEYKAKITLLNKARIARNRR
jgi:hypothetical protein